MATLTSTPSGTTPRKAAVSINRRLIAATVGVGLLVSVLATAGLLWQAFLAERELISGRLDDIERTLVPSLAASLWYVDEDRLDTALDGIANVPAIEHVRLVSAEGETWERGTPVADPLLQRRYPLRYEQGRGGELGMLEVTVGNQRVGARLRAQATSLALTATIALLGSALLYFLLFRFWVTRHLAAMSRYARELRFDAEQPPLRLPGHAAQSAPDELQQVADSINLMRERTAGFLALRAEYEAELLRSRDRLEEQVQARTAELREKARALHDSEARLRLVADNMPALISHVDRDRRFTFNNRAYVEWLGRPLEQITGCTVAEVYGDEYYARLSPKLDAAFAGQETTFEFEARTRIVRVSYVPEFDDRGVVTGVYGLVHDITATKRLEQELRDLSQVDALTGLANRRRFEQQLAVSLARAERGGHGLGLMFLDLDRFKQINDSLGHEAGDRVLQEFGRRLVASVRQTDLVARLAGDEFVVLLEGLRSEAEAAHVAEKILGAMQAPILLETGPLQAATSIGIALRAPGELDGEALLRRADKALYEVKARQRGRFAIAAQPGGSAPV